MRARIHCALFCSLCCGVLVGCGFQLPAVDYAMLFAGGAEVVPTEEGGRVAKELRALLAEAGVEKGSAWRLNILSYKESHDSMAVNRRGIVAEYRLYTHVDVELKYQGEKSRHNLSSTRYLRQNFFLLNDTLWEEAYLREEMDRQLARRILQKMIERAQPITEQPVPS